MHPDKIDLLGLTPEDLEAALAAHFESRGQPQYRTKQVTQWIFEEGVETIEGMTNLPAGERTALSSAFTLGEAVPDTVSRSSDGTVKHLWKLADGELVERPRTKFS